MKTILMIEDDVSVQFIHQSYLKKMSHNFDIVIATNIADSEVILATRQIDLILLDVHLEDGNGLQLLSKLRKDKKDIDVILITASKEAILVKESLHLGVIDYLIKPFDFDRFSKSIALYEKKANQFNQEEIDQSQIDDFFKIATSTTPSEPIEKGLDSNTLEFVISKIQEMEKAFTISELTNETKLSHVSIRKYVTYLEKHQQLTSENIYLKVGRPYKVYKWCP